MTPPNLVQEAADVAALRVQQNYLERTLTDLQKQNAEGLANIAQKLDQLNDVRTDLAKIDARLVGQSDSLARAHHRLDGLSQQLAEHVQESTAWREQVQLRLDARVAPLIAEQHNTAKTLASWRGTFVGVQGVMMLLLGLLTWLASGYIGKLEGTTKRVEVLERRSETTDRRIDNTIQKEAAK